MLCCLKDESAQVCSGHQCISYQCLQNVCSCTCQYCEASMYTSLHMSSIFVCSPSVTLLVRGSSFGQHCIFCHHRLSCCTQRALSCLTIHSGLVCPQKGSLHVMSQAVQHIEAMVGNAEACAQYDRLVKAVKGSSLRNTTRRVMPALHSY